jgi:hypothetical protein
MSNKRQANSPKVEKAKKEEKTCQSRIDKWGG